jgi:DNA-binding response OmpR family regulator
MARSTLAGRFILIVEDEMLVALDIACEFEKLGAQVVQCCSLRDAILRVEDDSLSAAILDHGLRDGDSTSLCQRLIERGIPFVTYTGYADLTGACTQGAFVMKPCLPSVLTSAVEGLLTVH